MGYICNVANKVMRNISLSLCMVPQLLRLLESTECDMIRAVQRRITRELTLVISERARQDTGLPTGTPPTSQDVSRRQ